MVVSFASGFGPPGQCRPNQNPLPGFIFVYSVCDLIQVLEQAGRGPVRVCFCPLRNSGKLTKLFDGVSQLIADFSQQFGATVYAVDEVWNAQRPDWSPDGFRECVLQWRHYDLTVFWTAQVPQLTDARMRSVSTEIYCGRVITRLDLDAVRACGFPEDAIEKLPTLPDRTFIHKLENGLWKVERS